MALLVSATATGQLIVLLATPILTRVYVPHQFGVLTVFNAITAMVIVVSSLRYEIAIPLPRSVAAAQLLTGLSLSLNVLAGLILVPVILLFGHQIATALNTPDLEPYLLLLPVVVIGAGSFKVLTYWAIRRADFRFVARAKISQAFANVGVQVLAGLAGGGVLGLIAGQFLGYVVGVTGLLRGLALRKTAAPLLASPRRTGMLMRRHKRFPLYDAPASLVDVFSMQLPSLLLAATFGPVIAGLYMLADRVLNAPVSLLAQAVGQVLYSRAGGDIAIGGLRDVTLRIVRTLSLLALGPAIIVFFAGQYGFAFVFGDAWRQSGVFASWLVIGLAPIFVFSSISLVLSATGGQSLNLYIQVSVLIFKILAMGAGVVLRDPLVSVIGYSLTNAVGYSVAIVLILRHLRNHAALRLAPAQPSVST